MTAYYIEHDPYIKEVESEIECNESRCVCRVVSSTSENGDKVCAHVRRLIHRKSELHRFISHAFGTFSGRHRANDFASCKMEGIIVRTDKRPQDWTSGLYASDKILVITITLEVNGVSHYGREVFGYEKHKWFTHYEQWITMVQADGKIVSAVLVDDKTRDHEHSTKF